MKRRLESSSGLGQGVCRTPRGGTIRLKLYPIRFEMFWGAFGTNTVSLPHKTLLLPGRVVVESRFPF